jgi:hypothetical protein
MNVQIGSGNLDFKRTRFSMSHLADDHCCGSHVHFLILWPLSISSTSEIIAHQAAGCDVLQLIHRADKRATRGFSLLLLFGFYLFRTTFFGWYIIIYVIFPRPSTQEVSDLRPGPFMHGFLGICTTEDWTTSQIKTDIQGPPANRAIFKC